MSVRRDDPRAGAVAARSTESLPSLLACLALLILVRGALLTFGFRRTTGWLGVMRDHPSPARDPACPGAEAVGRRVAEAASVLPGRILCLEQSLVLCWLLRRRGVAARLRLGVQAYPVAAHAWVEVADRPVFEIEERLRHYSPLRLPHERP